MSSNPFLISADELEAALDKPDLKVVDASWYLPTQKRNGREEYDEARIPGAVYFDIDEEAVNVVYKRHDGNYGLLQPVFD